MTHVATITPEFFDRELLDELTRCWRMLSAAASIAADAPPAPMEIAMPA